MTNAFLQRAQGNIALGGRGYHIEFVYDDVTAARTLCERLAAHDILPKLGERKGSFIVYLKHSDDICNLLALMGAQDCLLRLHDEIAMRDVRNCANRRTNCDVANTEKQVTTARRQVEIIKAMQANGTLATLDERLRTAALARLENPDATLLELASILGITKSGVVHRLKRLLDC